LVNLLDSLYNRLYKALLNCGFFDSDSHVRTLFVDARLALWQYHVPEAQTQDMRVRKLIDALLNQYNEVQANGLVLLLQVIKDQLFATDVLYQELSDLIHELAHSTVPALPDTPEWEKALTCYRAVIYQNYCQVQIFGQPRPLQLSDIFTDVYVLEQPQAFRRVDIRQLRTHSGSIEYAKRLNGFDLLLRSEGHRLFVLGKPGAGKTTFLKYIALQAAQRKISKVPLFIQLKKWVDSGLSLQEYIQNQFISCKLVAIEAFVTTLLQTGQALLLCDGLDEVSAMQEPDTIAAIKLFAQGYPMTQIVITCRNAATDYTFEGFTYVEIADFDEIQITTFADRWFHNNPEKHKVFLEELANPAHRGLRELCRIPLLLTMLCLAFELNMTFPQRRVDLYADALDALLRKWDSSRNIKRDTIYHGLSISRKHQFFARIAARMFEREEYFISQKQLERQILSYLQHLPHADTGVSDIDEEAILKSIEAQHGIIVEQAHHIYAFAHLTFQEYYTARYTVENAHRGTLPRLLAHVTDIRWREVILLTASLFDNADDFFVLFRHILKRQIQIEPMLQHLLVWATRKATALMADGSGGLKENHIPPNTLKKIVVTSQLSRSESPGTIYRCAYCLLALNELQDRPHIRTQAFNLARVLDREGIFVQSTTRLPMRSRRRMGMQRLTLPPYLILDRTLSQFLHRAQTLAVARDYDLAAGATRDLNAIWADVLGCCQRVDAQKLYQVFSTLELPTSESSASDCLAFANHLRMLLHTHCDLAYAWNLTVEQSENLAHYFYSVELFVECLDLAYVTNRTQLAYDLLTPYSLSKRMISL